MVLEVFKKLFKDNIDNIDPESLFDYFCKDLKGRDFLQEVRQKGSKEMKKLAAELLEEQLSKKAQ